MRGLEISYFAEKLNETDVTIEDAEYIAEALEKAIHDRGMTFGGGMNFPEVEKD